MGVLCFRAWWEASSESPWVFGDASLLHDLKRLCLFRRDKVPARNTHKIVRLRLYALKKVFEGSKGRFFKNAPWQGVGQRPTKRGKACTTGHAFSGGTNTSIRKRGCKKILSEFFNIPDDMGFGGFQSSFCRNIHRNFYKMKGKTDQDRI